MTDFNAPRGRCPECGQEFTWSDGLVCGCFLWEEDEDEEEEKMTITLRQAVVFCVLMEGNGGILNKSPDYIMEKLRACEGWDKPEPLLDSINNHKFLMYAHKWLREDWEEGEDEDGEDN